MKMYATIKLLFLEDFTPFIMQLPVLFLLTDLNANTKRDQSLGNTQNNSAVMEASRDFIDSS